MSTNKRWWNDLGTTLIQLYLHVHHTAHDHPQSYIILTLELTIEDGSGRVCTISTWDHLPTISHE